MTKNILVSTCLLGEPVRYDGSARTVVHAAIERWRHESRVVAVCPETAAGFGVPRLPAEIAEAKSGEDVLSGNARVIDTEGTDVTDHFVAGAREALALAQANGCAFALMCDGSPSCGSRTIHDGTFTGRTHAGAGVTVALLGRHGIEVFAESEIDALGDRMRRGAIDGSRPTPDGKFQPVAAK